MEKTERNRYIFFAAISALLLFVLIIAKGFGTTGVIRKINYYDGLMVVKGLVPYKDFVLNKNFSLIGTIYFYALFIKLFGDSVFTNNMINVLVGYLNIFSSMLLTSGVKDRHFRILIGICFALLYVSLFASIFLHSFFLSMLYFPLFLGVYFRGSDKIGPTVISGMLAGVSVLTIGTTGFIFYLVYAFGPAFEKRETWEPRPKLSKIFPFIYGSVIVFSMFFLYLILSRAFDDFFHQTFLS